MNVQDVFRCNRCGYCCHGETTVSLDDYDQQRMLAVLNISREEALRRYWRLSDSGVQMRTVSGHCIFYDEGCRVHEGRPWRCRQWPLVPAIVHDPANLDIIRQSCPGISRSASIDDVKQALEAEEQEEASRRRRE